MSTIVESWRSKEPQFDSLGRVRPVVTRPGYRRGQRPPNYGRKLPAEVLTPREIARLIDACPITGPVGARNRALIVVLWRGGLRSAEALALETRDVDAHAGTVTIRHGKGNKRRVVGLDPAAFAMLEEWFTVRSRLGIDHGPIFCTAVGKALGRPLGAPYWRETIKRLGEKAGIEKRVHTHGLRHTHAVELMREGVPLLVISRQLGHSNGLVTQRYLDHLEPGEVIATMRARTWAAPVQQTGTLDRQLEGA